MTCYLGSRGQTRVTSALHGLATSDGEFIRLVGLSDRERHETFRGEGPSTGNDALPLGKCFPEVEVLEVAPAGGVGTADRLLGRREMRPLVLQDVITGDDDPSRSMPGGHDTEPSCLQIKRRGTHDTRERMHHDHDLPLESLPSLRRIDPDLISQGGFPRPQHTHQRRVHDPAFRAVPGSGEYQLLGFASIIGRYVCSPAQQADHDVSRKRGDFEITFERGHPAAFPELRS
jgi:hypothetical protein